MSQRHLPRLLPCMVLLLGIHLASARFASDHLDPIVKDTCPFQVMVGEMYDLALVPMQETIDFQLNPNLPLMLMKFRNDDSLYRALVNGTMVKLYKCDVRETNCTVLTEEATKGSDYLAVREWNRVLVKYINGEITVSVNMKVDLMGKNMIKMAEPAAGHNIGTVTFLAPNKIPFYSATVNIPCDDAAPPVIDREAYLAAPPAKTRDSAPSTPSPIDLLPFPHCPVYQLEPDHQFPPTPIQSSIALAVYPIHPILHLDVTGQNVSFKLRVNGGQAKLLTCNVTDEQCSIADTHDADDIITPEEWNEVLVHLENNEITVDINNGKSLLHTNIPASFKDVKLYVMAPQGSTNSAGSVHFIASVNVDCRGIMQHIDTQQPMPFPTPGVPSTKNRITPTPTQEGLSTTDSDVETSTEAAPLGVTGKVIIIVVVLLVVLLIIALVIVYKKRHSAADINHTQLQEQEQRP